jgi:hypothetical protein
MVEVDLVGVARRKKRPSVWRYRSYAAVSATGADLEMEQDDEQ